MKDNIYRKGIKMIMPFITLRWRRVVIDIDTQKHFFLDKSIACIQNRQQVLSNVRRVMNGAYLHNIGMISTVQLCAGKDYYRNFYLTASECEKKLNCTLCNRRISFDATGCTDLSPEILENYAQIIFYKRCFDPFEEPRADRMLSELNSDEFILIGASTEGAVKATALGLLRRRKKVTVLVDAVGSYKRTIGEVTLRLLRERGAKLADTDKFLGSLDEMCGYPILRRAQL